MSDRPADERTMESASPSRIGPSWASAERSPPLLESLPRASSRQNVKMRGPTPNFGFAGGVLAACWRRWRRAYFWAGNDRF
jgi:hypothetical protein